MPPEPLPWDRKERKQQQELVGGSASGSRWREPPPHHHYAASSRTLPDFRSRGHCKQGGWHMYPEESGHGVIPSRSNEKIIEDESCRRDGGKCVRNSSTRENRSFGQRDWRGSHSASPSGPARQHNDATKDQRLRDHNSGYVNTWDQSHSRDQHSKSANVNGAASNGQRCERENSLTSIEWRPLKWTRSGSLSSRGSLSQSGSSKSMGVDSNEAKPEVQQTGNSKPVQSLTVDATACVTSAAPCEDTTSRKKPRLGWGEGLAKYEKKKVDGPEDSAAKLGSSISGDGVEPDHSPFLNLADNSPRVAVFQDCPSPATPSSVACSSSPGVEDKQAVKATDADEDGCNLSGSPSSVSEGLAFNLESFDLTEISNINSSIDELLQLEERSSVDSGYMRSTAVNKLLLWKSDISKALEKTEAEIDSLENELKTLISVPSASCSTPKEGHSNSNLQVVIPEDVIGGEDEHTDVKVEEDIDSPGSATSKFVELPPDDAMKHGASMKMCSLTRDTPACGERSHPASSYSLSISDGGLNCGEDTLYNLILAANKDTAHTAFQVFKNLLPSSSCSSDFSRAASVSSLQIDPAVKERFARRKQFQQFKEKIIALKFRIHQYLWKEDIHMRKFRTKSQKKCDLSPRPVQIGHQKHRSAVRSRFSAAVGNSSLVPSSEMLNFASRLLSDSEVKVVSRNTLRMPALILDYRERAMSRFISKNSLVEDPCAVEKERSSINPWTSEEREVFIDKLAIFGKDFRKIASFLDHKTTADCVEFYYKNHKSDCFQRRKRKPDYSKQAKVCSANTYLVASSGKRWSREANSVSLDILGAAIAANSIGIQQNGMATPELERSKSPDSERETVAADVLAGICGSLSSEAMSSCITSSADPGEGNQKVTRLPLTPEVTQCADDESCSDESSGEMDPTDWTDEEKAVLIQAVSAYGKDFSMVSRCVRTRSRDQCKIFFSKARKCLGLDKFLPGPHNLVRREDLNDGHDPDDCLMETEHLFNEKSTLKPEEEVCVKGGISNPDMTSSDDKDGTGELDSVDTELVSNSPVQVNCEEVEFSTIQTGASIGNGLGDVTVAREESHNSLPDVLCGNAVSANHLGEEIKEVVTLPEHGLEDRKAEIAAVSRSNCDTTPNMVPSGSNSLLATAWGCPLNGSENITLLESDSDFNKLKSNILVQRKQITQACNDADSLSKPELGNISDRQGEKAEQPLQCTSRLGSVGAAKLSRDCGSSALQASGYFFQKCNGSNQAQQMGMGGGGSSSKPSRSGDVKLFGQILSKPCPQANSSSSSDDSIKQLKVSLDGNTKFERNNNHAVRSFGFWDGNRIQTGFSSLPDSAILLAKYPAAFGNFAISQSNEGNMNNFPTREVVNDYQVYRGRGGDVQPFTIEMKQRQDVVLSEMQRRNGFDGMQQQARGGMVVGRGGGILVSDPVAAIKMHYAKAEQKINREDDSWADVTR